MTTLKIATYNIHKGFSHFNRRMVLHDLRDRLRELNADILFLQEVQGESNGNVQRHLNYPTLPQHEFLADQIWPHHAYGKNAVYDDGHHGNAILSRYPIVRWDNQDISAHRFESRGLLHCEIELPGTGQLLHCICVHFGLFKRGRGVQFNALVERINRVVPADAPLIIAGDFNDWLNHASRLLAQELQLHEVFDASHGKLARSYPAGMPLLCMDRIYVRGLEIRHCDVHAWRKISDHVALSTNLKLP
ncbi:MAG: endonuclease/exonuclease/phosphatase family protein [Betaproteobacteria bacterium]|nr:endonuclease/exonuclease/phosphatase family protein [Betaproteobacteria bacterium]